MTQIATQPNTPQKSTTTLVYALQAASFLLGITGIIGVIINYVKRKEVKGTWLESHFKWQIRTFWWGLLWAIIGIATFFVYIGFFILMANTVWYIYRFVRGYLRLNDGYEMYVKIPKYGEVPHLN